MDYQTAISKLVFSATKASSGLEAKAFADAAITIAYLRDNYSQIQAAPKATKKVVS